MSIFFKCLPIVLVIALATPSVSQLPRTSIYCFDMDKTGSQIDFKNARYLTAFNPTGYNNQPQWINNNELFIAVQTPYDTNQTEIYSLSLLNNVLTQVTATRESEYSPTLMPDRRNISCIRVDATQYGTQRLWSYPIDRNNIGRDLLPLHQDIGYRMFAWQGGYGAITVSPRQINRVKRYIANQMEHHKVKSSQDEYVELLDAAGVEYDPKYLCK